MVVQHNMTASNANRMLGNIVSKQAKATEKLSSGYRINRAADDAAGLSISEKMRSQIRGLNQASTNAQDGISLIQTAEGGLNETHSILQRMRELAVQASNGTETDEDRSAVNNEISELQEELTRIADTTEFNTMKLLDGTLGDSTSAGVKVNLTTPDVKPTAVTTVDATKGEFTLDAFTADIASVAGDKLSLTVYTTDENGNKSEITVNLKYQNTTTLEGSDGITTTVTAGAAADTEKAAAFIKELKKTSLAQDFDIEDVDSDGEIVFTAKQEGKGMTIDSALATSQTAGVDDAAVSLTSTLGSNSNEDAYQQLVTTALGGYTGASTEKLDDFTFEVNGERFAFVDAAGEAQLKSDSNNRDINYVVVADATAIDDTEVATMTNLINSKTGINAKVDTTTNTTINLKASPATNKIGRGIELQIGANEGQTMSFGIGNMSARALGVDGNKVDLSNQDSAKKSITIIDNAIKTVSQARGKMGAVQNRLEHTISNLDNTSENLQTAESNIRDVDMASEMVEYSKNSILQQAAQSMLAQANQANQGVLSLLQ